MAIFQDPRFAAKNYQMRGTHLDHTPRHKFMFWVKFVRTTDAASSDPNSRWPNGVSFKVLTIDRPRFTFKTQTHNSYNKKRVVQSGVEYQPVSIKFYDTYDDTVLKFIQEYSRFYFGDFNNTSSTAWRHDQTDATMEMGAGQWGYYNGIGDTTDESYFFDRVEIYAFGNGKYTRWDLIHPKITEVSPDTYDYADGNSPSEITISLAYEGVIWPEVNEDLDEETAGMMALDEGEYGEFEFNKLTFIKEDFGSDSSFNIDDTADTSNMDRLYRPESASPVSSSNQLFNSVANVGTSLGLNFGQNNLISTIGNISSLLPNIGNLTSSISSVMTSANQLVSNFMGKSGSFNIGNIASNIGSSVGSIFSGFFNDDELTASDRTILAKPVSQSDYTDYVGLIVSASEIAAEFRLYVSYGSLTISTKEALDQIDKLANNTGLIFVGETSYSQIISRINQLMVSLSKINAYLRTNNSSSKGASHAAYEAAWSQMQKLGVYDKALAASIAGELIEDNKKAGYNSIELGNSIDSNIFAKINSKLSSEAQVGSISQNILQKPGLNPVQRSLRHTLDRSPTYLQQLQVYMENDIAPSIPEDDEDDQI